MVKIKEKINGFFEFNSDDGGYLFAHYSKFEISKVRGEITISIKNGNSYSIISEELAEEAKKKLMEISLEFK